MSILRIACIKMYVVMYSRCFFLQAAHKEQKKNLTLDEINSFNSSFNMTRLKQLYNWSYYLLQ